MKAPMTDLAQMLRDRAAEHGGDKLLEEAAAALAKQPAAEAQAHGGGEVVAWIGAGHLREQRVNAARAGYGMPLVASTARRGEDCIPLYTAPPSAPVEVEGFGEWYGSVDARLWNNWDACNAAFHAGKRAALAQQPAAVDVEMLPLPGPDVGMQGPIAFIRSDKLLQEWCRANVEANTEALRAHIGWLHKILRENGKCVDGGHCHHRCGPAGKCFRQDGCVPLTGSGLTDKWELPARQPQDNPSN